MLLFAPLSKFLATCLALSQVFSIFLHEHLLHLVYFVKPLIDLLLTFNGEKQE